MLKKMILYCILSVAIFAEENYVHRVDGHAPIGVMQDHKHHKNEIMMSYRPMIMTMNKFYNGSKTMSLDSVKLSYSMVPTSMQMTMHMVGVMWGLSNDITIVGMTSYSSNSMEMIQMNQSSTMISSGLNDLKLSGLVNIMTSDNQVMIGQFGISLPIGSIEEKNSAGTHLPYGMQLGSGTYDVSLGLTTTYFYNDVSFGGQVNGIIRTGRNKYDYRLGHKFQGSLWGQKLITSEMSATLRSVVNVSENIEGKDNSLSAMVVNMNPEYTTNQGEISADIGIGINFKPKHIKNTRFGTELLIPIYQKSNAISLMSNACLVFGIQKNL